ncbi:MAG: hypothetical protein H6738_25815, partial [Alphaproteobacteria bacterium]|nr:hypothetical protein [Alphaproteobacteria bacterium]
MTATAKQAGAALSPETYLPRDGSDVGPEYVSLVQPFVDAGLVTLEPYDVVYCSEVEDDSDDRDPWCDAFIEPADSEELECMECGHVLWYEPHHVRQRFRARVEQATVEAWLQARLEKEGEVERLRGGCAWRVLVGGEEIVVAVLDWSEDARWVDAGRMDSDPTVLVLVEPFRYRTALRAGVVAVDLEQLALGLELGPSWQAARDSVIRFDRPRAWLPSH